MDALAYLESKLAEAEAQFAKETKIMNRHRRSNRALFHEAADRRRPLEWRIYIIKRLIEEHPAE